MCDKCFKMLTVDKVKTAESFDYVTIIHEVCSKKVLIRRFNSIDTCDAEEVYMGGGGAP